MKKLTLVLIALLLGVTQLYSQDAEEMKAIFSKMNTEFSKMMVEDNFAEMLELYSDNIISMPSYQPILRGVDALKKSHDMQSQSGVKITAFELNTTDVIIAGEYFIEIGSYSITMSIPNMKMPWDDHGKYLNVWEKDEDDELKILVDTWNTDVNPWMEMAKYQEGDHDDHGKPEKMEDKENEEVK